MEAPGPDPQKTPASYAEFPDEDGGGGWLKTAVQFFAIPMLIVILAVSIYLGVSLMVGGGPSTTADFVEMLKSDTVTRRWHAAQELAARLHGETPDEFKSEALITALCEALDKARLDFWHALQKTPDPSFRNQMTGLLRHMETSNKPSVKMLAEKLQAPRPRPRSRRIAAS